MTVYEMIQRHKAVKKEIRQSGISASQKAHKEQQQTMRRVTQQLGPVFETLPLVHKSPQPGKHRKDIPTSPVPTSSQPPAEVPAEQSIEPSAAAAPALSAMQQNLWNKAEQASWESDSI